MTLNGVMAIILRYFAEFGRFRGQLRKSGWSAINRFSPEKCHKVHQLSTTDALCSSRQRSFLFYNSDEPSNIAGNLGGSPAGFRLFLLRLYCIAFAPVGHVYKH